MARKRLRSWPGLVLLLLSPLAASACGLPNPALCTLPSQIRLVGSNGGARDDAAGRFRIVLRDLVNQPVVNGMVVIDFSGCPDVVICADQLDPDVLVYGPAKTVRKFTDADGTVSFTVLGGSTGTGTAATRAPSAQVYCDGVLIGTLGVAAFDLDGVSGLGAADLTAWLTDFASGVAWGRSDYDANGTLGAGDLADWLTRFASGASATSCSARYP